MKKSHTRTVKLKFLSDFFQKLFNQLKHKSERLEQDIKYIKDVYTGEKTHNERGAGRKSKLSSEQIAEIQSQRRNGISYRKLAEKYDCSAGTIYKVCSEIK